MKVRLSEFEGKRLHLANCSLRSVALSNQSGGLFHGVGMMLAPGAGALALVWVIGAYSVVMGVILVALAFRLKKHTHS